MTTDFSYKLGRYKITEAFSGGLWWESHHGVGSIQKGKCTIEGSILILGPSEAEEPGFLKREFMEHLDKLSGWDKTKYYCLSHSIHKCRTGERLTFPAKMDVHVGVLPNAGKVKARDSFAKRETSNNRAVSKKEIVFFKDKITKLLDFLKQFLKKSSL